MKVQAIYNSKILKKGLEFAADNGSLFVATASLALSTVARPIAIMAAPKTDLENKKYACAKSLASSAVGYFLMLAASSPVAKAVKNIDKRPYEYLKKSTVENLKAGEKSLKASSRYKFASQLFKLGLGFVIAVPTTMASAPLLKQQTAASLLQILPVCTADPVAVFDVLPSDEQPSYLQHGGNVLPVCRAEVEILGRYGAFVFTLQQQCGMICRRGALGRLFQIHS